MSSIHIFLALPPNPNPLQRIYTKNAFPNTGNQSNLKGKRNTVLTSAQTKLTGTVFKFVCRKFDNVNEKVKLFHAAFGNTDRGGACSEK